MRSRLTIGITVALGLFACGCEVPSSATPAPHKLDAMQETEQEVGPIDKEPEVMSTRWARRLHVDRLQAAITVVAGADENGEPIVWLINGQDALDDGVLGITLGRPDYVERTMENPAVDLLYAKLMRDMARNVCTQMRDADSKRGDGATHTLWRFAPVHVPATEAQITENLQYLILRFLGYRLDVDHALFIDFYALYDAAVKSTDLDPSSTQAQMEGWRGVCIGLFESPLFHIQ